MKEKKEKENESMELELVLRETMRTETSSAGKKYIIIKIHLQTKPADYSAGAQCSSMHDPLTEETPVASDDRPMGPPPVP